MNIKHSFFSEILARFNENRVFSVTELARKLGDRNRNAIEILLNDMNSLMLVRKRSKDGVFELRCDLAALKAYIMDQCKNDSDFEDEISELKDELDINDVMRSKWVYQGFLSYENRRCDNIKLETAEEEKEKTLSIIFDDDDDEDVEEYNVVKDLAKKYISEMPDYDSKKKTFSSRMAINYPNGKPFKIKFEEDADKMCLYFSDNGGLYSYIRSLFPRSSDKKETYDALSLAIVDHVADDSSLFREDTRLRSLIDPDYTNFADYGDLDREVLYLFQRTSLALNDLEFIKEAIQNPPVALDVQIDLFIKSTKNNKYSFDSPEMMKDVASSMLKRILNIDWRTSKSDAIEAVDNLLTCWRGKGWHEMTIKIFETIKEALNGYSEYDYQRMKVRAWENR